MWMYFLTNGGVMCVGLSITPSHVGGLIWQSLPFVPIYLSYEIPLSGVLKNDLAKEKKKKSSKVF
jgi:hypothetical protein